MTARLRISDDGDVYLRDAGDPDNASWRFVAPHDQPNRLHRRLEALAPGADLDAELEALLDGREDPVDVRGEVAASYYDGVKEVCRAG